MTTQGAERWTGEAADGNGMRALVSEAWAATDVVADKVGPSTREAAFKLVLEAMLRDGDGGSPPLFGEVEVAGAGVDDLEAEPIEVDDVDVQEREPEPDSIDVSLATPEQRAWAIADYLKIGVEQTLCLYDVTSSAPVLYAPADRLSTDGKKATRELTLLVIAGRSAVGTATGTEDLRCAASTYAALDDCDLMSALDGIDEVVVRGDPDSVNRLVRLRGIGVEAARSVAARIAGA